MTGGVSGTSGDGQRDVFVFEPTLETYGDRNRIRDFENGIDVIDLSAFGFTDFETEVAPLAHTFGGRLNIELDQGMSIRIDNMHTGIFDASDVILA